LKKIIIVSPHFPPSNLAAVHRSRLFAMHLPEFGWKPIIVTVDEKYYEETLDPNLSLLLPKDLRVEKVKALDTKPIRLIGDIGIRGFYYLYRKILHLCASEKIDFLYIPIPSHFAALIAPLIHKKTGVPYGIDYIDPWVHRWPGTEKIFSKAWFSMKLGEMLEPRAVKNVSLITGVASGYYDEVLQRNPNLAGRIITAAMPYGGEAGDHDVVNRLGLKTYLFEKKEGILDLVYAGAMLPKAFKPLEEIMRVISANKAQFKSIRIHFIGSGSSPNDPNSYNIRKLAEQFNLWETVFFEYPKRIPYFDVLTHLNACDGAFILGSTEPHYTPSKVYQAVLSNKPILAILHEKSSAYKILEDTHSGVVLAFMGEKELSKIRNEFLMKWQEFLIFLKEFKPEHINRQIFEDYSARSVTKILAKAIDDSIELFNKLK
jgi:hypothetical protein